MARCSIYERAHHNRSRGKLSKFGEHGQSVFSVFPPSMYSWKKLAQKTRVPAGTVLGIVFLYILYKRGPTLNSLFIGGAIAVAGALLRVWAAGHIEKGKVLTQGGPYGFTRNPLYLGSFFMAL